MSIKRLLATCLLAIPMLTACSSSSPLIPNKTLQLTTATSISLSRLAVIGAVYMLYDPLAPNWEIEESKLTETTFRFSMKMKRYNTGGAGESIQILKRRASQLQYEQGFGGYQILEYAEGIDSQTLGARRVAEGVVKLVQPQQADSYLLN